MQWTSPRPKSDERAFYSARERNWNALRNERFDGAPQSGNHRIERDRFSNKSAAKVVGLRTNSQNFAAKICEKHRPKSDMLASLYQLSVAAHLLQATKKGALPLAVDSRAKGKKVCSCALLVSLLSKRALISEHTPTDSARCVFVCFFSGYIYFFGGGHLEKRKHEEELPLLPKNVSILCVGRGAVLEVCLSSFKET